MSIIFTTPFQLVNYALIDFPPKKVFSAHVIILPNVIILPYSLNTRCNIQRSAKTGLVSLSLKYESFVVERRSRVADRRRMSQRKNLGTRSPQKYHAANVMMGFPGRR